MMERYKVRSNSGGDWLNVKGLVTSSGWLDWVSSDGTIGLTPPGKFYKRGQSPDPDCALGKNRIRVHVKFVQEADVEVIGDTFEAAVETLKARRPSQRFMIHDNNQEAWEYTKPK
jgi:hypothetical protein